jgi:acyl-[acyl-carrier-protein] desaturase
VIDVFERMQDFVAENLSLLAQVDQAWQPSDFLPDLAAEDWSEQLHKFRETSETLPDELLVVLVGNMVTEEALPNYAIRLEHVARDETGTDETPWARWLRGWTAEENRHGDLLNAYLRLTGRVDMRSVEQTIHYLIRDGFNPRSRGEESSGLIYAAFQERATRITFYTRTVGRMIEQDPESVVLSLRAVLKGLISMPGSRMFDGQNASLFDHFAIVSQRMGTYTIRDYAEIIRHLIEAWEIGNLSLSGAAAKAQDYLCRQPERYENLANLIASSLTEQLSLPFRWLKGRSV